MAEKIYWKTSNGKKINVDDMDEKHLRNTLKMLIRNDWINISKDSDCDALISDTF